MDPPSTIPEVSDLVRSQIEVVQEILRDNERLRRQLNDLEIQLEYLRMAIARGLFEK